MDDTGSPSAEIHERALEIRRAVLGSDYVDKLLDGGSAFTRPFQEWVTNFAWAQTWLDDTLDRKTRSLITLAIVTVLGQQHEIRLHARGALRNGATADELAAALKHVAVYAGVANAVGAIYITDEEIERAGKDSAPDKDGVIGT